MSAKAPVKPKPKVRSAASKAASARARARALAAVRSGHKIKRKHPKKRAAACATADAETGYWIAGDNDTMPVCVSVALANAILAQTGKRASPADLEALSAASGDEEGAFMEDALKVLRSASASD